MGTKSKKFRYVVLFTLQFVSFLFISSAYNVSAGILGDCVSFAKETGKVLEKGYQTATKPVRDVSNTVYRKTIRKPFNELKGEINKAIPDRLKYIYKDNVERRFRPATDFCWDATTGRKPFSEAAKQTVKAYVDQAKELLVSPELYLIYQSAKAASDPLPKEAFEIILPHWHQLTNRNLYRKTRYIVSGEIVDILSIGTAAAITLYDIVIFRDSLSNKPESLALLAHEMVHVDQYHDLSFMGFAAQYYVGGKLRKKKKNPLEREAYELEDRMLVRLNAERINPRTYQLTKHVSLPKSNSINVLATATAMGGTSEALIPVSISEAIVRGDRQDIDQLAAYAIAAPDLKAGTRSEVCRMIASDAVRSVYAADDALDYAKLAVNFDPENTYNWYFLAKIANSVRDIKTEYEALVQLASMMIEQELLKQHGGNFTPRMRGAEMHLNRAAALGEMMGWREGFIYDTRLPFILLVSMGLELRPTWFNDKVLLTYANRGITIDKALHKMDRWHFNLADVVSQVGLRAGVNMRDPIILQQCISICLNAHREYNNFGRHISGIPRDFDVRMKNRAHKARSYIRRR